MAEVIDGTTGLPEGSPPDADASNLPLAKPVDVRREMAKVYREARSGKIDKAEAAKLVWILGEVRKSMEAEEIERRLSELEARNVKPGLPAPR